jgi:hypothetical protein
MLAPALRYGNLFKGGYLYEIAQFNTIGKISPRKQAKERKAGLPFAYNGTGKMRA